MTTSASPQPSTAADSASSASTNLSAKIVVSGGFGVGKTTFVGAVSEIKPLRTEESMTMAAAPLDDSSLVSAKESTTVAMDFGRLAISDDLTLYLFGTPGQGRFAFMWNQISSGALGAIVLVDTGRLSDSFAPIDYFESRGIPYVVAVNKFDHSPKGTIEQIRSALALADEIPIVETDARDRDAVKHTLIALIELLLVRSGAPIPS